jgi:hypothetical protein
VSDRSVQRSKSNRFLLEGMTDAERQWRTWRSDRMRGWDSGKLTPAAIGRRRLVRRLDGGSQGSMAALSEKILGRSQPVKENK